MTPRRWWKPAGLLALAVLALMLPFFFGPYRVSQFTLVLIYAIAVLGLNLLVGYSGQISLGHGAFFCLGAYTGAILLDRTGLPHLLTVPAAALVCFAAAHSLPVPRPRPRGRSRPPATPPTSPPTPPPTPRFRPLPPSRPRLT